MGKEAESEADLAFEQRKWNDEVQLRSQEIKIRDREVEATIRSQQQSRWTSPLVLAVLGRGSRRTGKSGGRLEIRAGSAYSHSNEKRRRESD